MIEFFLNELLYLVLVFLLLHTIRALIKKPKANKIFPLAVAIVSFHSLMYFTLLLANSDSIWYPDLIRIKTKTAKSGIDLGFGNFISNIIITYLINIICIVLALIGLCNNSIKSK